MATDKKKARKVSTVFGKQKITTSPQVAAKIASGEISPTTHTFSQQEGSVNFAPKRRAVVGGSGIMPTANSAYDGKALKGTNPSYDGKALKGTNPSYDGKALKGTNPSYDGKAVPATNKAGQEITPAQNLEMQEQKAIKIAPHKEQLAALAAEINALSAGLDEADDDTIGVISKKIEAFKAAQSAPQG